MLTVAEALKLEPFLDAEVVAGKNGLQREIKWVHNIGVHDAARWLDGGKLALTTANNMPTEPAERCQYLRDMIQKNVTALAIGVGKYIQTVPQYLCEIADEYDFPLIAIPYEVRSVDIAKVVNERIAQEMVRRAISINQTLTQLILEGGGLKLQQLAEKLAELISHSISIENRRFEAVATVNIAAVDEARRYTQKFNRTDPRLVEALETRGFLPKIRETLRPVYIRQMPDVGLELERILAPIVVHGEIYGFIWIIADNHALSEIDMMAIESASTVAALMILYQESVQSAEATLKGDILSQLIQGQVEQETILNDQSLRYGVDLRLPFLMIIIEHQELGLSYIYRRVNQLAQNHEWQAVVGKFSNQVIILMQASKQTNEYIQQLNQLFVDDISQGLYRIAVSPTTQNASSVQRSYHQCQETLEIAHRLQNTNSVIYFADLGYLHTLYHAGKDALQGNPLVPCLLELQQEVQADLFHTLDAYLDTGGNGVQTAEVLHIHRSTLNYRLSRISQICAVDLSNPKTRLNLQIAIKLILLFQ